MMGRFLFAAAAAVLILMVFVLNVQIPSILIKLIGVGGAIFYLRCLAADNKFYVYAITLLYLPMAKIAPFTIAKGFNLTNILMLALFARYYLFSQAGRFSGDARLRRTVFVILIFITLALLQGLIRSYSDDSMELVTYYFEMVSPWLFYLGLSGSLTSEQDVRHALTFSCVGSALSILNGFNEFLDKRWAASIEKSRLLGPLQQPNTYGAFIAYVLPVCFSFILFYSGRLRLALVVLALMGIKVMVSTFSRGSYVALGGAILAQLYCRGRLFFVLSILGGSVAVTFFPQLIPESVKARMIGNTFRGGEIDLNGSIDASVTHRLMLWDAAEEMIKESPIIGKGLLSFPHIVPQYLTESLAERDTHNMYMKIMVYMGIPALLAYLAFFLQITRRGHAILKGSTSPLRRSIGLGAIGSCVSLLISCMFGSRMENLEMLCYFMTMAAIVSFLSTHPEIEA